MRKLLLTVFALILTAAAWAEDERHSFGLQIGFAEPIYRLNSPASIEQNASNLNKTVMNGFKAGFVYDGIIIGGFGASIGINYTFAAGRSGWNDYGFLPNGAPMLLPQIEYSTKYVYNQGEIFTDWQYKFEIARQTFLILYTGPTIQYGVYKADDLFRYKADGKEAEMEKVNPSYQNQQEQYLRQLNVTWGVGAGFQYRQFFLRGGYDFGIINPYRKNTFSALDGTLYVNDDRWTRGRLDQWQIKIGMYLFQMN